MLGELLPLELGAPKTFLGALAATTERKKEEKVEKTGITHINYNINFETLMSEMHCRIVNRQPSTTIYPNHFDLYCAEHGM